VVTADTTRDGSCKLVSSVARGALIDYSVQVASSSCQVASRVRKIVSVGLLFDDSSGVRVDSVDRKGGTLPYSNAGDYTPTLLEAMDDFRSWFDISVVLRTSSRERWIDPGSACTVSTTFRGSDTLACKLLDAI
jgi:hypothetical protein